MKTLILFATIAVMVLMSGCERSQPVEPPGIPPPAPGGQAESPLDSGELP